MATERVNPNQGKKPRRPPATTPDGEELRLQAIAYEVAEQQMLSGKASSQMIVHFLKSGSVRERKELMKLEQENELLKAKIESLASASRMEEKYDAAIAAMRAYSGQDSDSETFFNE